MKRLVLTAAAILYSTMSFAGVNGSCGVTYLSPGWKVPVTQTRSVITVSEGISIINIGEGQMVSIALFTDSPSSISIMKKGPCPDFHCNHTVGEEVEFSGNLTSIKLNLKDFSNRSLVVECNLEE